MDNKIISKEDLEIIIENLNESAKDAEDMFCVYNDSEYDLKEIYNDGWSDEGKYSSNFIVYTLQKDKEDTGIRLGQSVTKWGSYYSDYEWEYESIALVEEKEMTIKKWSYCKHEEHKESNQTLKFLGRGSAFNTIEGNTSAYFIKDNILFLIDCGETIFHKLITNDKLKKLIAENQINDIQVYITHLHSDHIGSLSSLIYYCYFILGMKIKIHYPDIDIYEYGFSSKLITLLTLQGNDSDTQYEFLLEPHECIKARKVIHVDEFKNYCYMINIDNKKIFYSGDCSTLPSLELAKIHDNFYDEMYIECAINKSNVHLDFEYLNTLIPLELRDKIYLMHIDNTEKVKELANKYNFKIVELDN